jgi:hypothetical protein
MSKMKGKSPLKNRRRSQDELDRAAAADAREGIRQGLEDVRRGRGQPAREFFKEFDAKHGISKPERHLRGKSGD